MLPRHMIFIPLLVPQKSGTGSILNVFLRMEGYKVSIIVSSGHAGPFFFVFCTVYGIIITECILMEEDQRWMY